MNARQWAIGSRLCCGISVHATIRSRMMLPTIFRLFYCGTGHTNSKEKRMVGGDGVGTEVQKDGRWLRWSEAINRAVVSILFEYR